MDNRNKKIVITSVILIAMIIIGGSIILTQKVKHLIPDNEVNEIRFIGYGRNIMIKDSSSINEIVKMVNNLEFQPQFLKKSEIDAPGAIQCSFVFYFKNQDEELKITLPFFRREKKVYRIIGSDWERIVYQALSE